MEIIMPNISKAYYELYKLLLSVLGKWNFCLMGPILVQDRYIIEVSKKNIKKTKEAVEKANLSKYVIDIRAPGRFF